MTSKSHINWKLFTILLGAGAFSFFAILPYLLTVQASVLAELPIPLPLALTLSFIQTMVLLTIAIFVGLKLGSSVGLETPLLSTWIKKQPIKVTLLSTTQQSALIGITVGVLIIASDYLFSLAIGPLQTVEVDLWKGFLASFYGGIVEEILLRLFLMTLFVWIVQKVSGKLTTPPKALTVWGAIIAASIIFGLGHLPATALLTEITPMVVARAIILNSIGGIVFGWLYWKKGFEAAVIAHFTADIVLLVSFPLMMQG